MMMLWFRDLSLPDGETIRRHQAIIQSDGSVWWGWLKRKSEGFPTNYIIDLSRKIEDSGVEQIMLYHSDARQIFRATLEAISALPGGFRIRSPEMDLTPPYMHESVCPAWFELKDIESLPSVPSVRLLILPTVSGEGREGAVMVGGEALDDGQLRGSGSTLCDVEVVN